MVAVRRRLIRAVWRFHRWLYRATGGRVGSRIVGMPVLLLTTIGRRTGRSHTTSLTYSPHGASFAVIGSNGGAPNHPDWVLNLRANPRAAIQIRGTHAAVQAREAARAERSELWDRAVQSYSGYAAYQSRTSRMIPVVILELKSSKDQV
ncbi:MAG: nitroreductase family deazaflavin-dependent oxidoreductase [Nitrospiraceae bacterium]